MIFKKFLKSFAFAFKGFYFLIKFETNFKIQFVIAFLAIIFGFYFNISTVEWLIQIITIALVLSVEAINSCIEKICNYIQPNFDAHIGKIKDIAAAASLIACFFALLIGLLIYIPKITLLF